MTIETGHFYFLKDDYYRECDDPKLMKNKENVNGVPHGRPCFFAFIDSRSGFLWLVPISSQVEKFKAIAQKKIDRYGSCDTILFGEVLGHEKAFLIQNMCPATEEYIESEYLDKISAIPVQVEKPLEDFIIRKAKSVLAKQKAGVHILFTDIEKIEAILMDSKR